jgi:hypothetical protein
MIGLSKCSPDRRNIGALSEDIMASPRKTFEAVSEVNAISRSENFSECSHGLIPVHGMPSEVSGLVKSAARRTRDAKPSRMAQR